MKSVILPVAMLLLGSGAGIGTGLYFMPAEPVSDDSPSSDVSGEVAEAEPVADQGEEVEGQEYVRLNNQFVVPVVEEARVVALVVLSLSLEVSSGSRETVFGHEPKLRDSFLQVLFDHANIGGFSGNFTSSSNMRVLRTGLRESAQHVLGDRIIDVLIIDIVRQDIQG